MPCKRAAPTGLTPRKKQEDVEISKPAAFKHFTQREKKHAMAQVLNICLKLGKKWRLFDQMFNDVFSRVISLWIYVFYLNLFLGCITSYTVFIRMK